MWIFCCGMYRSASTLQFQIAARLVKDAGLGEQVGWIDWKRFPEVRLKYANSQGLKVCKSHVCCEPIISEFLNNNAKGIYIHRDIRDVYASSINQMQKSFDELWSEGFLERCLDNYKTWTTLPQVLVSKYEEVIDNIPKEVKRISEHLEIHLFPKQYQKIASDYTTATQQKRIASFKEALLQMPMIHEKKDRKIVDYHDEESLLHINHIDSGKVGRWSGDLSVNQVEQIDNKVLSWCRKNQYSPSTFLHYN